MFSWAPCDTLVTEHDKYVVNKILRFANRVRLHIEYNYQGEEISLDSFTQLRKATDNCFRFDPLSACLPTLPSRWKKSPSAVRRFLVKILLGWGLNRNVSENSSQIKIGKNEKHFA